MSRLPTSFEINLPGCFLAGGAILSTVTRTEINDYDVYPKSNKDMIEAFHILVEDGCFVVNISDRAVTFKSNTITNDKKERAIIQVMTYDTFETPEKIFGNFDFSVCMGAFDFDTKTYTFHNDFFPDIASKTLRFNPGTLYPLNSVLRVNKYHSKGFFVGKMELIRMMLTAIDKGAPKSWAELESQIGGAYGRMIKLVDDGVEFSMQAAMDRLEQLSYIKDTDHGFLPTHDSEFEGIGAEDLELMFSLAPVDVVVNSEGDVFHVTDVGPVSKLENMPKNANVLNANGDYRFIGYKVLSVDKDGNLISGIYSSKPVRYELDKDTVETESPYLFVFPSIDNAKNRANPRQKVFKVSYDAGDLRTTKKSAMFISSEVQVSRMRLEEEVVR